MMIISKVKYKFEVEGQEPFAVEVGKPVNIPDWARKTRLYQLAFSDGSIQVLADAEQLKAAEKDEGLPPKTDDESELREKARLLGIKSYKTLTLANLVKRIDEAEQKLAEERKETDDDADETDGKEDGGVDGE